MEGRLVLKRCSIFRADGRIRTGMAIVIEGERVSRVALDEEVPVLPGDWAVSCNGRLVAPGLVDCHTHLVGGQVMPLSGEALLRPARALDRWQRTLEGTLTAAEVEVLSAFAMAQALRQGVTMIVEHLRCPNDVEAALGAQARAATRLGIRLSNSHSSSSERGEAAAQRELEQNAAYCAAPRASELVRPALGFHRSSSCSDALLSKLGELRRALGVGVHGHLSESDDDLTTTFSRHGCRVLARLDGFGLLGSGGVMAYGRAINRAESERLMKTRTLVALSPRLGLTSEPMGGGLEALLSHQNLLGLGTSGIGSLWTELFAAFVGVVQMSRVGRLLDPDGFLAQLLIGGPSELCSQLFGAPCGAIEPGSLADLVLYDFVPMGEPGPIAPQALMQLGHARAAWTIVAGRVVMREGELLGHDFLELSREANRALQTLGARAGSSALG